MHKILFLGPVNPGRPGPDLFFPVHRLPAWLRARGHVVGEMAGPIDRAFVEGAGWPDFLISYGYQHVLEKNVLGMFRGRAINLHLGLLPWNRGADPNLWSWAEATPKGVSIHYIDQGINTGDLIIQKEVDFPYIGTFQSAEYMLQWNVQCLFLEHWEGILHGHCQRRPQEGRGSFHRLKDKERLSRFLTHGWDTPVEVLDDYAADFQTSVQFWSHYDDEVEHVRRTGELPPAVARPSSVFD